MCTLTNKLAAPMIFGPDGELTPFDTSVRRDNVCSHCGMDNFDQTIIKTSKWSGYSSTSSNTEASRSSHFPEVRTSPKMDRLDLFKPLPPLPSTAGSHKASRSLHSRVRSESKDPISPLGLTFPASIPANSSAVPAPLMTRERKLAHQTPTHCQACTRPTVTVTDFGKDLPSREMKTDGQRKPLKLTSLPSPREYTRDNLQCSPYSAAASTSTPSTPKYAQLYKSLWSDDLLPSATISKPFGTPTMVHGKEYEQASFPSPILDDEHTPEEDNSNPPSPMTNDDTDNDDFVDNSSFYSGSHYSTEYSWQSANSSRTEIDKGYVKERDVLHEHSLSVPTPMPWSRMWSSPAYIDTSRSYEDLYDSAADLKLASPLPKISTVERRLVPSPQFDKSGSSTNLCYEGMPYPRQYQPSHSPQTMKQLPMTPTAETPSLQPTSAVSTGFAQTAQVEYSWPASVPSYNQHREHTMDGSPSLYGSPFSNGRFTLSETRLERLGKPNSKLSKERMRGLSWFKFFDSTAWKREMLKIPTGLSKKVSQTDMKKSPRPKRDSFGQEWI